MAQQFSSPQEEIQHWRQLFEEKEEEFNDFVDSSKELEAELEQDLQMSEKKLKDVTSQLNRLQTEYDQAMDKAKRSSEETGRMIHNLQDENETLRKSNKDMKRDKQTLEQENDNLERQVRQTEASLQDLTEKMNRILEENAFLQTELEEKHLRNQEIIQRLTDDIRDLKDELIVQDAKRPESNGEIPVSDATKNHVESDVVMPSKMSDHAINNDEGSASAPTTNGGAGRIFPTNGPGSITLVNDILGLVKEMQQRLHARDNLSEGIESKH
eukprot:TRINITY_DN10832_c0_g1_i1.p1 TRINITY_DN10832_c0_g1~~TRINITY_DN10832_c0_g1_i1.p1  ORF type:complete len:270 (+),score=68.38 TRINITY_DN10832_c0_g1_i1:309-1118(+)